MAATNPNSLPLLPPGARWQQIPGLLDQDVAQIQARVDSAQGGHWHLASDPHMVPGTIQTNIDGYSHAVGRIDYMAPADQEFVLRAHADLTFLLAERARLKAELAESTGRTAALAEAALAVLNVRGPLIHQDSIYAAYDAVRRLDDPDAPSIHDEPESEG